MDIKFRILFVIIGSIVTNLGYVQSQGGGGIAIGLGMGGDFMMDTPLGEMPSPLFAMAGTANDIGPPANQQSNTGMAGSMGGATGSVQGGTDQTLSSSSTNSIENNPSKEPGYILQNEAFTALGNVGHLVRVPIASSNTVPKAVVVNTINVNDITTRDQPRTLSAGTNLELSPLATGLSDHSVTIGTDSSSVSITGEPVAMFNPGTGMTSEMAVLQASQSGNRVDMSGFIPPPFSTKPPLSESKSRTTLSSGMQNALLTASVASNKPTGSSKQTEPTYVIGEVSAILGDQSAISDSKVSSGTSTSNIDMSVSNTLLESHSKATVTVDRPISGSSNSDKILPHVQDLTTDGIYPFEGSAVARDATLDKKLQAVSALENAIRNTAHEPLHLESRSLSSNQISAKKDLLTDKDSYKSSQGNQSATDVTYIIDKPVETSYKQKVATLSPTPSLVSQIADKAARINAQLQHASVRSEPGTAKILINTQPGSEKVGLTTGSALPVGDTKTVRLDGTFGHSSNMNNQVSNKNSLSFDRSPRISETPKGNVVDTSSFLSNLPREITVGDPNYITVMGNLVGVVESKDMPPTTGTSPDISTVVSEPSSGAGAAFGVLTGSNGAPVTNMAGIGLPDRSASHLNQQQLNANSVINNFISSRQNMFMPDKTAHTNINDPVPSGSFIIGAGQPNAQVIKSTFDLGNVSPAGIGSSLGIVGNEAESTARDRALSSLAETLTNMNISPTRDRASDMQQRQDFAVDMSAFAQPTFDIPALKVGSFQPLNPSTEQSMTRNVHADTNVKDSPLRPSQSQTKPTNSLLASIKLEMPSTKRPDLKPPANIKQGNIYDTLSSHTPQTQKIINVQPGWANDMFPVGDFSSQANDSLQNKNVQKHFSVAEPGFTSKQRKMGTSLRQESNTQVSSSSRSPAKRNPVVGTLLGEGDIVPPTNLVRAPAVDFMTSFLNNPNMRNSPSKTVVPRDSSFLRKGVDQTVNQFGVAEIYTRKNQLNQSQWRDLLSSVSSQNLKKPSTENVKYQTLNVMGASDTIPLMKTTFQSRPPSSSSLLKNRLSQQTSVRTMFEAPGVSRFNSGGFTNVSPLRIKSVVGVPERKEFVESQPFVGSASERKPATHSQGGTLQMPIFQQLGIQKNLVSAPNSGSTREFAFTNQEQNRRSQSGSSASSVVPQDSKTFSIGQSVLIGDALPSSRQQSSSTGMTIPMDSFNTNQLSSTGLRLGQPLVIPNSRNQGSAQSAFISNFPSERRREQTVSQFTSGRSEVVFGSAGTGGGRTLGTRPASTSSMQSMLSIQRSSKCKYKPDPTSPIHFILDLRNFRHRFRCALGTAYDVDTCECSTRLAGKADCLEVHMDFNNGVVEDSSINMLPIGNENVEVTNGSTPLTGIALFKENSKLTIWRYQNFDFRDHVMLKVQFRPGTGGGRFQPLITNCDGTGGGPSIGIVYDSQLREVLLILRTDNDTNKELAFPINPNEWNDVTYIYDGQEFIGIVNGVRRYVSRQDPHLLGIIGGEIKSLPTQGLIEIRDAALVLGHCPRFGYFHGAMVDIQVYTCIPRDFRLE